MFVALLVVLWAHGVAVYQPIREHIVHESLQVLQGFLHLLLSFNLIHGLVPSEVAQSEGGPFVLTAL